MGDRKEKGGEGGRPGLPPPEGGGGGRGGDDEGGGGGRGGGRGSLCVVVGHIDDMDSMDMGNLLNNLLSNAVEAAEKKEGDKEVELIIRREGDEIEIELANSTAGSVLEKNPGLQSQKKEPELHGFGMASIQ